MPDPNEYIIDPSHRNAPHGEAVKAACEAAGLSHERAAKYVHLAMKHGAEVMEDFDLLCDENFAPSAIAKVE